jgi:hypothetical protein
VANTARRVVRSSPPKSGSRPTVKDDFTTLGASLARASLQPIRKTERSP